MVLRKVILSKLTKVLSSVLLLSALGCGTSEANDLTMLDRVSLDSVNGEYVSLLSTFHNQYNVFLTVDKDSLVFKNFPLSSLLVHANELEGIAETIGFSIKYDRVLTEHKMGVELFLEPTTIKISKNKETGGEKEINLLLESKGKGLYIGSEKKIKFDLRLKKIVVDNKINILKTPVVFSIETVLKK
ncbi:DUF4840 domain-containing protein [Myroides pelagicus]|uniref:DUF4840 domain-containing protein n=1 Tax=Myroides pelagicus TaxID=270914 RepID=A0A7K1GHE6_9FLAO|nr:DUF4840 domain-containing protein [Myroides pelagicus]MEC4113470.1 DUF4840 domain-containing protein [Myroides pelagicus]MTH28310.1 DUF4840 domain-containing protein [Myroides pelagicus]